MLSAMNATMLSDGVRKLAFVMGTFTDRLVEAFEASSCTRAELGAVLRGPGGKIGISPQAVGQLLAGKSKQMTAENTALAARFLRVSAMWLATGEGKREAVGAQEESGHYVAPRQALPVALDAIARAPADIRSELAQVLGLLATTGAASYAQRVMDLLLPPVATSKPVLESSAKFLHQVVTPLPVGQPKTPQFPPLPPATTQQPDKARRRSSVRSAELPTPDAKGKSQ